MQQLADALDTVRAAKTATPPAEAPAGAPPAAQAASVAAAAETDEIVDTLAEEVPPGSPEVPLDTAQPVEPLPGEPTTDEDILKALVNMNKAELEALAMLSPEDRHALALMVAGQTNNQPTEEQEQVAPDQPGGSRGNRSGHEPRRAGRQQAGPRGRRGDPLHDHRRWRHPRGHVGQRLADMDEVIEAMTKKINAMRGVSGDGEYVVVASLRRDEDSVDEDKIFAGPTRTGTRRRSASSCKRTESRESLVAAGWCAPRTPLYDIPGIGSTDTPVADSLPSFGVDRGGIIWTEPPSLGGVITSLGANSFVRWIPGNSAGTVAQTGVTGTTPTSPVDTKPCIDITCGVERSADLIALPLCLCFDLLTSRRTNPEFVKASTDLVQVAQAHFKEQWLLASLFGAPGVVTPRRDRYPDIALGAARDWLVQIRLVAAQFRWRNRLSATQQLRVYAPAWLRDADRRRPDVSGPR